MRIKTPLPVIPLAFRCKACNSGQVQRVKNRIGNGSFQVWDMCLTCGKNARGSAIYIPQKQMGTLLTDIPLFTDYTLTAPPCIICGSREGTENHHFAPRHIFEDAEQWPQGNLCTKHHKEWHTKITAHVMNDNCKYCKGLANNGNR